MADILDISGRQEPWHQGSKVHIQLVRSISLYLQRTNLRKKRKKERKKC